MTQSGKVRGMRAAACLASLTACLLVVACGSDEANDTPPRAARDATPPAHAGKLPPGKGHVLARVRAPVLVHDRPYGRAFARLRRTTPFDGARTLAVFKTADRRRWLAIHSPILRNKRVGWIRNDPSALDLSRTRFSLRVNLSATRIDLRRGTRTVLRVPISIGAAGTSTPTGRYQVTDKMPASRFPKGPYGCCILALSARQPNLPPGWAGGDRIAIHGTPRTDSIGSASSNGCLRASDAHLRLLMRDVPVGAPVFIRR